MITGELRNENELRNLSKYRIDQKSEYMFVIPVDKGMAKC